MCYLPVLDQPPLVHVPLHTTWARKPSILELTTRITFTDSCLFYFQSKCLVSLDMTFSHISIDFNN